MQLEFSRNANPYCEPEGKPVLAWEPVGFRTGQAGDGYLDLRKQHVMTPTPPSSSEGSPLPRRSRPNLGDFIKDTTELDLWAFDDLDPLEDEVPKPSAPTVSQGIPVPRERRRKVASEEGSTPPPAKPFAAGKNSVRVDITKEPVKNPASTDSLAPAPVPSDDFDDLDNPNQWEDGEPPLLSIHPSLIGTPAEKSAAAEEPLADQTFAQSTPQVVKEPDEFAPVVREDAKPVSLVPHLGLSKLEWIGLCVLCAMLLTGGGVVYFNSIHRLPSEDGRLKSGDFPVEGRHLVILSAETYWRAPVSEGENADTFRRGTQLLPVVELTSSGGPAAVRVIFRDQEGRGAGDVVTRTIKPGVPLRIAATAGFEDVGMHAAYRTGQTKPWTIEVLESPSEAAATPEFKKLFQIDISTDRR